MSKIVLGVGTSHSPLLAMQPPLWIDRGKDDLRRTDLHLVDGRVLTYAELDEEVADRYVDEATLSSFETAAARAQECLDRLAMAIEETEPDVLIVIGDDQAELFSLTHNPAFAVYTGDEIVMHPKNELHQNLPEWHRTANKGYSMDTANRHLAAPDVALDLVAGLIEKGVDVAVATQVLDPVGAGFGHAFGFVAERLIKGKPIAILPIMLNTYFPPNVPTPRRCFEIGTFIADVVEGLPGDRRVGVVASGGLSHFVTDEKLDRTVLDALEAGDRAALETISPVALRSGNSEILNWIMTGGAVGDLKVTHSDYIPVRRTPAGTGIGLAFTVWR
ncbi:DODA-type extradiol aromatic ring-opening family dioxygenase [Nocardia sp. NPDC004278]